MKFKTVAAFAFLWTKKEKQMTKEVIKIEYVLSFGKTNKKECLGYVGNCIG